MLMTRHFDYCPSASEGDNQSVRSSAPVVSRCFPGGYNVKLYISRGRLALWLLAFLHSVAIPCDEFNSLYYSSCIYLQIGCLLLSGSCCVFDHVSHIVLTTVAQVQGVLFYIFSGVHGSGGNAVQLMPGTFFQF